MDALQVFLVVIGLLVASGGVYMLIDARNHSASARGPYVPIAIAFIGFMIAYKAYAEYNGLDTTDVVILFLFVFALMFLLGIQFFIVDKSRRNRKQ